MSINVVDSGKIHDALAKVFASPNFRATPKREAFLEYIVRLATEGKSDAIKAYGIGIDVYGRDSEFDPQKDSLVRMEAGRLRRDLEHYYLTDGALDEIRFSLPKGRYIPNISTNKNLEKPAASVSPLPTASSDQESKDPAIFGLDKTRSLRVIATLLLAGVVLMSGMGIFWQLRTTRAVAPIQAQVDTKAQVIKGPSIYVIPFETVSHTEETVQLAHGLTIETILNLSQFPALKVYPAQANFKVSTTDPGNSATPTNSWYEVGGTVQISDGKLWITARLRNLADGQQLWSERFEADYAPDLIFTIQETIAANVARKLAEPFGLINEFERRKLAFANDLSLESYKCVLLAYKYRQTFTQDLHLAARNCLERATQRDPDYARAWALLSQLTADEYRWFYNVKPNSNKRALTAANRAIELDPMDVLSYQSMSLALFNNGEIESALKYARQAVALNPHNKESLWQLGFRNWLTGNHSEGLAQAERALRESPTPAPWFKSVPALDLYNKGLYQEALPVAEEMGLSGLVTAEMVRAMIYGQLGLTEKAQIALDNCRRLDSQFDQRARHWFEVLQVPAEVIDHFMQGIYKAGLKPAAEDRVSYDPSREYLVKHRTR